MGNSTIVLSKLFTTVKFAGRILGIMCFSPGDECLTDRLVDNGHNVGTRVKVVASEHDVTVKLGRAYGATLDVRLFHFVVFLADLIDMCIPLWSRNSEAHWVYVVFCVR